MPCGQSKVVLATTATTKEEGLLHVTKIEKRRTYPLKQIECIFGAPTYRINTAHFTAGVYFVSVTAAGKTFGGKLLVTK